MKPNETVPNAADTEASDPVDDLTARMPSGTQCSTITYQSRQCQLVAAAKKHSHSCSDDSYEQTCHNSDMDSDDFRDDASTRGAKRGRKQSAAARVRPPSAKHVWVSVRQNDDGSPFLFKGFTAAYAYMHDEFAVKGCDGMTLIDRGGDATKWAVVYRYACAYHNYVKCPFVIRIRIVVVSHVPQPARVCQPLLSLCFPSPRDAASTFCPLALSSHFLSLRASHCLCHCATPHPSLSFSLCIQPP